MQEKIKYEELKGLVIYDDGNLFFHPDCKWSNFWSNSKKTVEGKKLAGGNHKTPAIRIKGNYYTKTHVIFCLHNQR